MYDKAVVSRKHDPKGGIGGGKNEEDDDDVSDSDQEWVKLNPSISSSRVTSTAQRIDTNSVKFDKNKCLDVINAMGTFTVLQIKP